MYETPFGQLFVLSRVKGLEGQSINREFLAAC
jgi:hypothetical protein